MGDKSAIEWTDSTWNPVTGCSKVSPGCAHCYAEALSLRYGWSTQPWTPAHAAENVVLHEDRINLPYRWKRPRRIFVNSMSDLFHEQVPDDFIRRVFVVMHENYQHTYQVLTKRPERMRDFLKRWYAPDRVDPELPRAKPPRHIWIGTSVENQHFADERIPLLLDTPAAVRFLSCEPLLGPLNLSQYLGLAATEDGWCAGPGPRDLHWIIAGGESGPHHRPAQEWWLTDLRDQAREAGVAFLFKQWGGKTPKSGGRELDGRTWDEYPAVAL